MKEELRGDLEMSEQISISRDLGDLAVLTLLVSRVFVASIGIWIISFRRVSLEICERVSLALDWKGLRGFAAILVNSDS